MMLPDVIGQAKNEKGVRLGVRLVALYVPYVCTFCNVLYAKLNETIKMNIKHNFITTVTTLFRKNSNCRFV